MKERRRLICVVRETPYNLIHIILNMETLTLAGGIICPATPSFYSRPKTLEEIAGTVVDRSIGSGRIFPEDIQMGGMIYSVVAIPSSPRLLINHD